MSNTNTEAHLSHCFFALSPDTRTQSRLLIKSATRLPAMMLWSML
jgi:hypothetical protein